MYPRDMNYSVNVVSETFFSVRCPNCTAPVSVWHALSASVKCKQCGTAVTFAPQIRRELLLSSVAMLILGSVLVISLGTIWGGAALFALILLRMSRLKRLVQGSEIKKHSPNEP